MSQLSQLEPHTPALAISPLREVWTIAWPTVLTMTSYTIMQFIDKLMVGQVSPAALAAQTNGGIWSFSLLSFALGVLTVVNTYVSQNLGAGTPRNGPKYAWAAMWLAVLIWVIVMLPYGLAMPWMFGTALPAVFPNHMGGHSADLIAMEAGYAQILILGSIFLLAARGVNQFFFGMHRPRIITFAAIVANTVNVLANYVLIFGRDGIPAWGIPGVPGVTPMGIYGAAYATVLGTVVEFAVPMFIFLGRRWHAELGTRTAWRFHWKPIRELLTLGWPAAIQWGNELICWAIFMTVLVGKFGEDHMAACAIAFGYMGLSFMPAVGFSVATNSLVGKYIGAGKPEIARARTRTALILAMIYMTTCAAIFLIFRRELVGIFISNDVSAEQAHRIIEIGAKVMIASAFFQTVDALGIVYTGALRGAGDTVWPGLITMAYSWTFIVGGGVLVIYILPELKSLGPWIAAAVYIVAYGLTMWWRFASGKWRSIRLLDNGDATPSPHMPVMPGPPVTDPAATVRDMAESIASSSPQQPVR